jgi:hypothetical protein
VFLLTVRGLLLAACAGASTDCVRELLLAACVCASTDCVRGLLRVYVLLLDACARFFLGALKFQNSRICHYAVEHETHDRLKG